MGHSFLVNDNELSEHHVRNMPGMAKFDSHRKVRDKLQGEMLYSSPVQTIGGASAFFDALSYGFNGHVPLTITPDGAWLTILSGLVHHIDTDPEGLRHHFVEHKGKKTLLVKVQASGIHSASEAVWLNVIRGGEGASNLETPCFSDQLKEHLGKKHDLIVSNFTTTTDTDRISSMVSMMGAMKHFFEYKMMMMCGLNRVTVEGTPDDWADIHQRVQTFSEFGLGWWTDHLLPVIDQFRLSCEGRPDLEFWKAAYLRHRKGSGGEHDVSGWINTFFPYAAGTKKDQMAQNPFVNWEADHGDRNPGLDHQDFPFGMVIAPVEVNDHGTKYNCNFYGGLVGVAKAEDHTVKAVSGLAITNLGLVE